MQRAAIPEILLSTHNSMTLNRAAYGSKTYLSIHR